MKTNKIKAGYLLEAYNKYIILRLKKEKLFLIKDNRYEGSFYIINVSDYLTSTSELFKIDFMKKRRTKMTDELRKEND